MNRSRELSKIIISTVFANSYKKLYLLAEKDRKIVENSEENTMAKMTREEIRIAGQAAKDAYSRDYYSTIDKIEGDCPCRVFRGHNSSSEDKYNFETAASYSWDE